MQKITSISELTSAIQLLEAERAICRNLLKERLHYAYESLKPINILKSNIKDIATSPHIFDNVLDTVVGLVTGFLSKKIIVGSTGSLIRKIIGSIMQVGIASFVSSHSDAIKSIVKYIFQQFDNNKEVKADMPE